jgi:hypothetical protein
MIEPKFVKIKLMEINWLKLNFYSPNQMNILIA